MWWVTHWHRRAGTPKLEDRIDFADERRRLWEEGYRQGYHDSFMYEHAVREWIRGGGKGPMPKYTVGEPPRSEFKRLLRHYEKRWRRGER